MNRFFFKSAVRERTYGNKGYRTKEDMEEKREKLFGSEGIEKPTEIKFINGFLLSIKKAIDKIIIKF